MASTRHADIAKQAQPGDILLVAHEFVARSPDELSLSRGDRIELIERDDDFGDGWYLGRHLQNGNTGLFPEVYTTTAPRASPSSANKPKGPTLRTSSSPVSSRLAIGAESDDKSSPHNEPPPATSFTSNNNVPTGVSVTTGPAPTPTLTSQPRSASQPLPSESAAGSTGSPITPSSRTPTQPSTMMNETLSVIDEHITNMNKPRGLDPMSSIDEGRPSSHDSASQYSANTSQTGLPLDFNSGAGEDSGLTEQEVSQWSPSRVAEYLETIGVETSHCDLFRTEEFTGEVLLQMDQSQLFMKELDLGPIGRRMKTWQKIKALQDEVRANMNVSSHRSSQATLSQSKGQTTLSNAGQPSGQPSPRPSAASIRSLGHHRRHSSTEQASATSLRSPDLRGPRIKQSSFDRGWTLSAASQSSASQSSATVTNNGSNPARSMSANHLHTVSADRGPYNKVSRGSSQISLPGQTEVDKGYISGGEGDAKRNRNVLRKKDGLTAHDRTSSYGSEKRKSGGFFWQKQRSTDSPVMPSESAEPPTIRHSDGVRIVSEPIQGNQTSPTVTRLEYDEGSKYSPDESKRASTASDKALKTRGFRTISDAVTGREKSLITTTDRNITENSLTESPDTTSASPSVMTPTYDVDGANKSEFSTPAVGVQSSATKRKSKKATSAYVRGLERRTPQEQIRDCDYSGWMKKKSSNLITTWKPRLFVLRGRRLSYYYSETDMEEKGVIDISNHRVLPADNDFLANMHAALTGATAPVPTSPASQADPTTPGSPRPGTGNSASRASFPSMPSLNPTAPAAPSPLVPRFETEDKETFLFKLVPPRSGLSKGVNFTRPSVHYFAVPTRQEGRLWMAALMKATIDRDETMSVITTYQQKTISLEQARARKERPPFLMGVGEEEEEPGRPGLHDQPPASDDTVAGSQEKSITAFDEASTTATENTDENAVETQSQEGVMQNGEESYAVDAEQQHQGDIRSTDASGLGIQGLHNTTTPQSESQAV